VGLEIRQRFEVRAFVWGKAQELDPDALPIVSTRPGVPDLTQKVDVQEDTATLCGLLGRVGEFEPGSGRGHVDDPAIAPRLLQMTFDDIGTGPVDKLPGQEAPELIDHWFVSLIHGMHAGPSCTFPGQHWTSTSAKTTIERTRKTTQVHSLR
jgi:hypothetical protein